MRRLSMLIGLGSILFGAFLIWMAYGFASMIDPDLEGAAQRAGILKRLPEHGAGPVGFGIVLIVIGLYLAAAKSKPAP